MESVLPSLVFPPVVRSDRLTEGVLASLGLPPTDESDRFTEGARTDKSDRFTEGARTDESDRFLKGVRTDESDRFTEGVLASFSGAFLRDSWPLAPGSLVAPFGTGLRSTVGVTLGALGRLGARAGVLLGLAEASNTLILSEMGVRPRVKRDMAALLSLGFNRCNWHGS